MNTLTNAGVLAENKLFATLDVTARALILPDGRQVMLIDTVGLVRRLPHHLVEAFKSTLEQAAQADVILNVCDASSPDAQEHLEVTREILEQLGCMDRPIISVMNKCDLVSDVALPVIGTSVEISALNGTGIERLLDVISSSLVPTRSRVKLPLPLKESGTAARLHTDGVVHSEEYRPEGIFLDVTAPIELLKNLAQYTYTGEE
jgi:GTP-binding protein HflX